MNLNRLASVLPALAAALFVPASANAAIFSFNFELIAPDASTIGTGTFSFDDSVVDANGDALVPPVTPTNGGLEIDATVFGVALDETNDIDFGNPLFPALSVGGFALFGLDYLLVQGVNGTDFAGATFNGKPVERVIFSGIFNVDDYRTQGDTPVRIDGFVGVVPAPAALTLFGLGALGLGLLRRRA